MTYRSKFEQRTADWFKRNGIKFQYEFAKLTYYQPVRGGVCRPCGSKDVRKKRTYLADFSFAPKHPFHVETKGRFTSADRTKMLSVKEHGDIRLVFQRDNKLNKTSRVTYSQWARQHGFKYSIGVPDIKWFGDKRGKTHK